MAGFKSLKFEPRECAESFPFGAGATRWLFKAANRSLARCKPSRRQLNLFPLLEGFLRGFHQRARSGSRDHFEDNLGDQFGMVQMDPVSAVAHHQMLPA